MNLCQLAPTVSLIYLLSPVAYFGIGSAMGDAGTRLFLWLGGREGSQPVKLFHSLISKSLLLNEKFEIKSIVLFSSVSFFFTLCMVCFPKNSVGFSDPSNLIILMKKYARLNLTISYSGSHYFNHNITQLSSSQRNFVMPLVHHIIPCFM